ncbi:hypothetical protein [Streptomyces sp. NPDC054866]
MFVLKVEARTARPDAVRQQVLAWPADVGSSASGWLGCTGGVSADGDWVFLMRFVSQEAAWTTSDLPGYEQWWRACRRHLETPPVFAESTRVSGILRGGSDDAAAVIITQGSGPSNRLSEILRRLETLELTEPVGVIGGFVAWHGCERFTEALYLASKGAQFRQLGTTSQALGRFIDDHVAAVRDARVIDLDEPWLTSPHARETL